MPLSKSLLITLLIVLLVWLAVWLQPRNEGGLVAAAYSAAPTRTERSTPSLAPAPVRKVATAAKHAAVLSSEAVVAIELIGVSGRVALGATDMDALWQRFNQADVLHEGLKSDQEIQVFVLYEDFDSQYSSAQVTVGYSREALVAAKARAGNVPAGRYQVVLRDSQDSSALLDVWQQLDFTRPIRAVLERHEVAVDGSVRASHVFVLYQ
jgi:hypothetical protein